VWYYHIYLHEQITRKKIAIERHEEEVKERVGCGDYLGNGQKKLTKGKKKRLEKK